MGFPHSVIPPIAWEVAVELTLVLEPEHPMAAPPATEAFCLVRGMPRKMGKASGKFTLW